jgi:hypothetical protein
MKTRVVELTLRVAYGFEERDEVPDLDVCKAQLEDLVKLAANRGLLSGDTDMVVDEYHFHVDEVPSQDGIEYLEDPANDR